MESKQMSFDLLVWDKEWMPCKGCLAGKPRKCKMIPCPGGYWAARLKRIAPQENIAESKK